MQNQSNLTDEQKIGQLFFIGLPGAEIDAETESLLREIQPGGVCLFARNIKSLAQTRRLNDAISEILPVAPFRAIDQEGGRVDRLKRIFPPMPAAAEISRLKNIDSIKLLAAITGKILRQLNFNLNFAPVADVVTPNRENSGNGLYSRNLGATATETAAFAGAYLKQIQAENCFGCLKHFPGLGAISVDSHERLPQVLIDETEFLKTDLLPFQEIFETAEVNFVMTAHAVYTALDWQEKDANGNHLPSSLSRRLIGEILRRRLNYANIVLTDDLEMGAIMENYTVAEAAFTAFEAGNDMLTICADSAAMCAAFRRMKSAVANNEISSERLNESIARILKIKNQIASPPAFDEQNIARLAHQMEDLKHTNG